MGTLGSDATRRSGMDLDAFDASIPLEADGDRMNMQRIIPFLLVVVAATCTACDRRESTGTSDISREGQGEVPEAARDASQTRTVPTATESSVDTSPQASPPETTSDGKQDEQDTTSDITTEREESDTLHRP
jgi:hypothetical protein